MHKVPSANNLDALMRCKWFFSVVFFHKMFLFNPVSIPVAVAKQGKEGEAEGEDEGEGVAVATMKKEGRSLR